MVDTNNAARGTPRPQPRAILSERLSPPPPLPPPLLPLLPLLPPSDVETEFILEVETEPARDVETEPVREEISAKFKAQPLENY
ncbi:MAG: hypothetical protein M1839_004141 [Geoglossum umbratile]|nr:MAG: hypothetical protein M1839_004141 [Geoglossum umbratile]